jgi:hypothetical protein
MSGNKLYLNYQTVADLTVIFASYFNGGTNMNLLALSMVKTPGRRMCELTGTTNSKFCHCYSFPDMSE